MLNHKGLTVAPKLKTGAGVVLFFPAEI